MKKVAIYFLLLSIVLIGLVSFVSTQSIETDYKYTNSLELSSGWNLVIAGYPYRTGCETVSSEYLCKDDIVALYHYSPSLGKYILVTSKKGIITELTEEEKALVNEEYQTIPANWIYIKEQKKLWDDQSNGQLTLAHLRERENQGEDFINRKLFEGWNLVPITTKMADKRIEDFKGNCNVEKAYAYDSFKISSSTENNTRRWVEISDLKLTYDHVGIGIAMKVSETCNFNLEGLNPEENGEIPLLPLIPQ